MTPSDTVLEVLRQVRYPGLDRTIVELGYVKSVKETDGHWKILLEIHSSQPEVTTAIEQDARAHLDAAGFSYTLEVVAQSGAPADGQAPTQKPLLEDLAPGVAHKLLVASGKGGVGKSTVAINLALALAAQGRRVGLLDADIYGPSVPTMLGVADQKPNSENGKLQPVEAHGIRAISLGFLVDGLEPIIWRGPLASRAIEQLLSDVDWSDIDELILDLPPGTGDIQISIAQKANPTGAVIVTTPQDVALIDAIRGVRMFAKVNVPVLGLVENMSHFVCPHCGETSEVFAPGSLAQELERLQVPILGRIPIDPAIATGGDSGSPIVSARPDSIAARAYHSLAEQLLTGLAQRDAAARGESEIDSPAVPGHTNG